MSGSQRPKEPHNSGGDALSRIFESAKDFVSLLGPLNLAASPPWPAAPTTLSYPELVLDDVQSLSKRFKNLKIPVSDLKQVLRAYRKRRDEIRQRTQREYALICPSQSHSIQLRIISAFSDYWVRTRDALLKRTIEVATQAAVMAPPGQPKMFNKEFIPMFEYVYGQVETGYLTTRDKRFLATLSDMEYRQITVWFQNRRARNKKRLQSGKCIPPAPTLEETATKLRALIADEDAKSSNQEQVVMTKKQTASYELEPEEEEEDGQSVEYTSQELYDDRLNMQYGDDEPSSLDDWIAPPGTFPQPFEMPDYEETSFAPPKWPRAPQLWLPIRVPVADEDVVEITARLEQVALTPPHTIVQTTVTLTQTMSAATAARCNLANKVLNSIRSFLPIPARPKPKVVKEKMVAPQYVLGVAPAPPTPQANTQTSVIAQIIHKLGGPQPTTAQVQVSGIQDPPVLQDAQNVQSPQVPQEAHPAQDIQVAQAPLVVSMPPVTQVLSNVSAPLTQHTLHNGPIPNAIFDIVQELPDICDKISQIDIDVDKSTTGDESDLLTDDSFSSAGSYSLVSFEDILGPITPEDTGTEPEIVTEEQVRTVPTYPLDHPLPRFDIPADEYMDDATMNEVLRVTLKQLDYRGPMPSDEPIVYTHCPTFAVNSIEPSLQEPWHMLHDDEVSSHIERALTGNRADFDFGPIEAPPPAPIPTAQPFSHATYDEQSQYHSVDISELPVDQFDSRGYALPFALTDPTLQMSHYADTSAVPTFDQISDPQGTALPFAFYDQLMASGTPAGVESMTHHPHHELANEEFQGNTFHDSYMFLDTSSRHAVPSAYSNLETADPHDSAISFYPSYLPQVPVISREVHRAACGVHRWIEKLTGITLKAEPFIDPRAMLQYLV